MFKGKLQSISMLGFKSSIFWILSELGLVRSKILKTAQIEHDSRFYIRTKSSDLGIIKEIYLNHIYEKQYRVKEGDVIFDIGSHIGVFTINSSRKTGQSGAVFAFEPLPSNFELLKKNLDLNQVTNTQVFNVAVSNEKMNDVVFHISDINTGMNSIIFEKDSSQCALVSTITLDDFVREHKIESIDFMKIDVEGHELSVLQGARKDSLFRCKTIILESHERLGGPSNSELVSFLEKYGFKMEITRLNDNNDILYGSKN